MLFFEISSKNRYFHFTFAGSRRPVMQTTKRTSYSLYIYMCTCMFGKVNPEIDVKGEDDNR